MWARYTAPGAVLNRRLRQHLTPLRSYQSSRKIAPALFCGFLLAACVLISRPIAEIGINDDWSYIWSAQQLARTGHIVYDGWTTSMLGWQLYLGALAVKLFGFSFTAVRAPVFCVAVITAMLLERLLVRFGLSGRNAVVGTLIFVLSPIFLPLSYSFMGDVPGLFSLFLCFYGCARALEARANARAAAWLAFAALTNIVGGTVRQIAWLGVLLVVPSTVWLLRRSKLVVMAGIGLWLAGVGSVTWFMHWAASQPYFIHEPLLAHALGLNGVLRLAAWLASQAVELCLLLLPLLAAFAWSFPWRQPRYKRAALTCAAIAVGLTGLLLVFPHVRHHWLLPFSIGYSGNYVSAEGLLEVPGVLGLRPDILPVSVRAALTSITFLCAACTCAFLSAVKPASREQAREPRLPVRALLTLLLPYTAAYTVLTGMRLLFYDRYLLPLFFVSIVLLLRWYQGRVARSLPWPAIATLGLFAVASVCAMHDMFADERARAAAAGEIVAAGYPRTAVHAGYEYDGWTQLEASGYVNDARLSNPPGAYKPAAAVNQWGCSFWFSDHTPSIHARYGLSLQPTGCAGLSRFTPVAIPSWLPPFGQNVYVLKMPQP